MKWYLTRVNHDENHASNSDCPFDYAFGVRTIEADREGIFLAVQAGYSPYGAVEALNRLAKLGDEYVTHAQAPEDELSDLAIQSLQGYFRSHPLPSERLAQAHQIIAQQHWETRKEQKPFHVAYTVHNGQFVK